MSLRPRPQLLNLGVVSLPRLGASRGPTNELVFSQLFIPTRSTTRASTRKSRFSTTSTPRSNHHHHVPSRPCSHQYHHHHHYRQQQQTRHNSTHSTNPSNPNPSNPNANNANEARITRLLSRLPRFLHPYLSSLRSSPSSFVVAFLILHEITAVVPGLGFFYLFHYCGGDDDDKEEDHKDKDKEGSYGKRFEEWVMGWMMELGYSEVMVKKMEGFERWFKRKGYFGFERGGTGRKRKGRKRGRRMGRRERSGGDEKYRVLVDAALAYAITKALLPVRIIASVQATPWFAGVLGRVRRVFGGGLRK
ncbi:hypothetical protein B0T13DRAFT_525358 [Neurospora crassa]|nr:hypothetical protein B0T13DRAFT_525378 [Neurospora crassa]KAK3485604.1 hypothetical protein B0T13DRAFT_525358 [Neurospora crassa]